MGLTIRLLGRPALERDTDEVRLEGRKTWALLAYVLLESRPPTRRELVDRLWSDADDPQGAMRWALSQVRKALAPDAEIVERDARLAFVPRGRIDIDARDLLDGRWDASNVDDLVRGDLLEGMDLSEVDDFARWLDVQRARVSGARTEAIRSGATLLARSEPTRALALAERGLLTHPYDEELHELIVEIHVLTGDRARAAAYVERLRQRYRADLGLEMPATVTRPLARALPAPSPGLRSDVRGHALLDTARARTGAGDYASAWDISRRVAADAAASGDTGLELSALVTQARVHTTGGFGEPRETLGLLQRALLLATGLEDRGRLADVEAERGRLLALDGRYGAADAALRRALAIAIEIEDDDRAAWSKTCLAFVLADRCEFEPAEDNLRDAIAHLGHSPMPLALLARVLLATGRAREARLTADLAVDAALARHVLPPLSFALVVAGDARVSDGDLDGAADRFERALAISTETGDTDWQGLALRGLATIARRRGDAVRSLARLREALAVVSARPGGMRRAQALILADLIEMEDGSDAALVQRALGLAELAPLPDLVERLRRYRPVHTPAHTPSHTRGHTPSS